MDMWDRTSLRYGHICRKRMARSFSTSFMCPALGDAVDQVTAEGKQNSESRRGRPFGGHPLRLAQESDIDGTEGTARSSPN